MKTLMTAITLLATALLASSGMLVSHASTQQNQSSAPFSLSLQGTILNAGNQKWSISGGNLVGAQLGQEMVPAGANLQYSLTANTNGLSATGSFQMSLTGTTADGQSVSYSATGQVVGEIASICFPGYDNPDSNGNCPVTDTSTIPAFFVAEVSTTETLSSTTTTGTEMLLIEAPIMNPWGAPLVITSTDGSVNVVATYSTATAYWSNVKLTGTVSGTFNGQQTTGAFSQTANAYENFLSGTENEFGTVALQSMSPSSLNSQGVYTGNSSVPTAGSYDCSALAGIPEGTCTETGLVSTGSFVMMGRNSIVTGTYLVNWPAPSVTFSGTLTGTVRTF
jgi:hypothetical protein